jgi:hypothetical protein
LIKYFIFKIFYKFIWSWLSKLSKWMITSLIVTLWSFVSVDFGLVEADNRMSTCGGTFAPLNILRLHKFVLLMSAQLSLNTAIFICTCAALTCLLLVFIYFPAIVKRKQYKKNTSQDKFYTICTYHLYSTSWPKWCIVLIHTTSCSLSFKVFAQILSNTKLILFYIVKNVQK